MAISPSTPAPAIQDASIWRRFRRNVSISALGSGLTLGIKFGQTALLTYVLTVEDFGRVLIVLNLFVFLDSFFGMRVSDAMTSAVRITTPQNTIAEAARMMAEIDAGVLPVGDGDRLVGMITDRDIAIRAVAVNKGPDTAVSEVMSKEVLADIVHAFFMLDVKTLPAVKVADVTVKTRINRGRQALHRLLSAG